MASSDDTENDLPPEIVKRVRFISSVAGLVLMAGLGTLAAVVIHKVWGKPQAALPVAAGVAPAPGTLSVQGKVVAASATGDRLTVVSEGAEGAMVSVFDLGDGREIARFRLKAP